MVIGEMRWIGPLNSIVDTQTAREILSTPIGSSSTADRHAWTNTKLGNDAVKSSYHSNTTTTVRANTATASSSYQPKHEHNATMDNLVKRKVVPEPLCLVCRQETKTIEHAVLLCPWTSRVWEETELNIKINKVGLTRMDKWLIKFKEDQFTPSKFEPVAMTTWASLESSKPSHLPQAKPKPEPHHQHSYCTK